MCSPVRSTPGTCNSELETPQWLFIAPYPSPCVKKARTK